MDASRGQGSSYSAPGSVLNAEHEHCMCLALGPCPPLPACPPCPWPCVTDLMTPGENRRQLSTMGLSWGSRLGQTPGEIKPWPHQAGTCNLTEPLCPHLQHALGLPASGDQDRCQLTAWSQSGKKVTSPG